MYSHRCRRIATAFLALATISLTGLASAANFGLSTTRIHLDAAHPVETLGVTNRDATPTAFEVQVRRWRQGADGKWDLVPDESLVVHPLIVRVQPGETARVRVGSLSPTVNEEQAYRIELVELPDKSKEKPGQVRMLANISLPAFVRPQGTSARLAISADALDAKSAKLVLRNTGSGYSAPEHSTLRLLDADGKTLQEVPLTMPYVLAGAQAPMRVALTGDTCARVAKIELLLPNVATVAAPVAPGARRCAP